MQSEIREGVGKQAYRDYVQALNKWLIPYFGTIDIAAGFGCCNGV